MKIIDRTSPANNPFAKFSGHRNFDQIVAECKAQGVELDAHRYTVHGDDHVTLRGGGYTVVYSIVNGSFFGSSPTGERFDNTEPRDGTPWFDALLGFFYYTEPRCNA